ncbi:general transcription factor IIF subunit 2-like [Oppia nitens]|uniref:general transcription factor IIF subunit 2-like n=1 Tax=Oppia nitens TaxID=1686743 RepID=UPI0023DB04AA|nr:general transcription factor IIF subunit 2-like [Oppia nitens]
MNSIDKTTELTGDDSRDQLMDQSVVDLSCLSRNVWLIKVPKYLSKRLENLKPMQEIGKLVMNLDDKQKGLNQVLWKLSPKLLSSADTDCGGGGVDDKENQQQLMSPTEHIITFASVDNQLMTVFSENTTETNETRIEGTVVKRGDCRPRESTSYLDFQRLRAKRADKTLRPVIQLDRSITVFKPISGHSSTRTGSLGPRPEIKCKYDKPVVKNMLFQAYEKHRYYTMRDLERLTLQPLYYLKEIVREICVYNIRNPHKYMWELKPEFRNYKK